MAVGDGVVWNEALPDNTTLAHQIDDYNRDLRVGVRSRMAREHMWPSDQTGTSEGGHHRFITFQQQTAAPSLGVVGATSTQVGALFVGSSGDGYPLTFENSAGTTIPIAGTTYGIMQTLYPVGSIYISTLATNPNTLLGFGTWEAFAAGRVLIGNGTSDAAYSAGSTGGESTHVLLEAELPTHHHNIAQSKRGGYVGNNEFYTVATGGGSANTDKETETTGSDTAHNNLQPYIVVYMWKRTA